MGLAVSGSSGVSRVSGVSGSFRVSGNSGVSGSPGLRVFGSLGLWVSESKERVEVRNWN